ncbi:MAG: hypothetical protein AAFX87_02485 [Bacteroidota bacterium]
MNLLKTYFLISLLALISLSAIAQPANDNQANAITLTDLNNWCSGTTAYTTDGATPDGTRASLWSDNPYADVWFKFQANSSDITIDLKLGTIKFPMIALWDDAGNEVVSSGHIGASEEVGIGSDQLTTGNWYYISVDTRGNNTSNKGTFGLCINAGLTYDFKEAAYEITDINNWCSATDAFSTKKATPDGSVPSYWGKVYANVWFKFQATSSDITIDVKRGDIDYPKMALWDASGNEVASAGHIDATEEVGLGSDQLVPGSWYYISVDSRDKMSWRGTFGLCINTGLTFDFKEEAIELTNLNDWCSGNDTYANFKGTPDGIKGANWQEGPNANVWFKFRAVGPMASIGLTRGSINFPMMAAWDDTGNELASIGHQGSDVPVSLTLDQLTTGQWYYISVDSRDRMDWRGTFGLCLDSEPANNDFSSAAYEISSLNNWCSATAEYTTVHGTPDGARPAKWGSGPNNNVWFKFQATTEEVSIDLKTGGDEGTLEFPKLALHDSGLSELVSVDHNGKYVDLGISYEGLNIGDWYYINVDNSNNQNYRGSFTLCVNDAVTHDYPNGAVTITSLESWCSELGEYTTMIGTPDGEKPSNWYDGPSNNVWFKFQAIGESVSIDLKTGNTEGTLQLPKLALHDNALIELASVSYGGLYSDRNLSFTDLTIGEWYYINVDNGDARFRRGTFTLCVDNPGGYNDLPASAYALSDLNNWCSAPAEYTTADATPDGVKPSTWSNGPNNNVWFKFQATTEEVAIDLKTGGAEGTLRYPRLALHSADLSEIVSVNHDGEYVDVGLSHKGLTIGEWYYINIDNASKGTFTLCLNDEASHDYASNAIALINTNSWCSDEAAYTTQIATADGSRPSAWTNGPNSNVWFKFLASANGISIDLLTGGTYGDIRYPKVALHDANLAEVASVNTDGEYVNLNLSYSELTPGEWYYINIDNGVTAPNRGTFTLCVDDFLTIDAPSNVTFENVQSNAVTINWQDNSTNESLFEIERSITPGYGYTRINIQPANATSYTDLTVSPNTNYYYRVRAAAASTFSDYSSEASVTTPVDPSLPAPPDNFKSLILSQNVVLISWESNDLEVAQFVLEKSVSGGAFTEVSLENPLATQYRDASIAAETQYQYRIKAVYPAGESSYSQVVLVYTDSNNGSIPDDIELAVLKDICEQANSGNQIFPRNGSAWPTLEDWPTYANSAVFGGWGGITIYYGDIGQIDLEYSGLVGAIPESISQLTNLYDLNMGTNELSGTIPSGLFNDDMALDYVNFGSNYTLGGVVPESVTQLSNLRTLNLSYCQFTDIPNLDLFPNPQTKIIWLSGNHIPLGRLETGFNQDEETIFQQFYPEGQTTAHNTLLELEYSQGQSVTLPNDMGGGSYTNYQWEVREGNVWQSVVEESTTEELVIANPAPDLDGKLYRCVMINPLMPNTNVISREVKLTLLPGIVPDDIEFVALKDLYLSTDGDNWTNNTGWPTAAEFQNMEAVGNDVFSSWYGITIQDGDIFKIKLDQNNLVGAFPSASINSLTALDWIDLHKNQLTGEIGDAFENAVNLRMIRLHYNSLSGTIPNYFADLSKLKWVVLNYNNLSGDLPAFFGDMIQLEYLYLGWNNFTGNIPDSYGQLINLTWFGVNANPLNPGPVPDALQNLVNCEIFAVNETNRTGEIPEWIGNLSQATYIGLSGNELTGTIPLSIGNLAGAEIELENNKLSAMPDFSGSTSPFDILRVQNNHLDFSSLIPNLVLESVVKDKIEYVPQKEIPIASELALFLGEYIYLPGIPDAEGVQYEWFKADDEISSGVSLGVTSSNPIYFKLDANFGDSGYYYCNLTHPESEMVLVTSRTRVTVSFTEGEVLDIVEFEALKGLYLSTNGDSWKNRDGWPTAAEFETMAPVTNDVYGDWYGVTTELGDIIRLEFPGNSMGGELPNSIGDFSQLIELDLQLNFIGGQIPPSVGNLTKLESLALSFNAFQGPIPTGIVNLIELRSLYLHNNGLTGELPDQIGNLTNLLSFHVKLNSLSGDIPLSISNLSKLKTFSAFGNQFTSFPDLSNFSTENLASLNIELHQNYLKFGPLLPNLAGNSTVKDKIEYDPQLSFPIATVYTFSPGETILLEGIQDVSGVQHEWFRAANANEIGVSLGVSTNSTYQKVNASLNDAGFYYCQWTHPDVPGLVLKTKTTQVTITEGLVADNIEFEALKDLYINLYGDSWNNRTNWPTTAEFETMEPVGSDVFGTWEGVTVRDGDVVKFDFDERSRFTVPPSIGDLSALESLFIQGQSIVSPLPDEVGGLSSLKELAIYNTLIPGGIPSWVTQLTNLEQLSILFTPTQGEIFDLSALNNLKSLSFFGTQLTGFADGAQLPNNLKELHLGLNPFNSTFPELIFQYTSLELVQITNSGLTGVIPEEIASLVNLRNLTVYENNLEGELPEAFGNMPFSFLGLAGNQFTGKIPRIPVSPDLSLQQFYFDRNNFTELSSYADHTNVDSLRLNVENNLLTFIDVIPTVNDENITRNNFGYSPQQEVPTYFDSRTNTLSVALYEENNQYQWEKDGVDIPGATSSTYVLSSGSNLNAVYRCRITNPLAPDLTLYSEDTRSEPGTFYAVASGNWSDPIWSDTQGGEVTGLIPVPGSEVYIYDQNVYIDQNFIGGPIHVVVDTEQASLVVDGAQLQVYDFLDIKRMSTNDKAKVRLVNGGNVEVLPND